MDLGELLIMLNQCKLLQPTNASVLKKTMVVKLFAQVTGDPLASNPHFRICYPFP